MAIVIPYVKQTWIDGNPANAASAARLGVLEEGILDVSQAPAVRVFHNAAQSATTAVDLTLAFNSERFDQAGGVAAAHHDTVTNNSRLTCLYAGVYQISGCIEWAANATGVRSVSIKLNNTTFIAIELTNTVAGGVVTRQIISTLYSLAVNDYVELIANQNSGAGLNVNSAGNYSPEFGMVRVA